MEVSLLVLIGLPGSGKSSFSKSVITSEPVTRKYNVVVVEFDKQLHYQSQQGGWKKSREDLIKQVDVLVSSLKTAQDISTKFDVKYNVSNKNNVIIIDDNMYYKSMRFKLFQIARNHQIRYSQLFFERSVQDCINAQISRNSHKKIPIDVIIEMSRKLERPGTEPWEANSFTISSYSETFVLDIFDNIFKTQELSPVRDNNSQLESARLATSLNMFHQIDLISRQIIGARINEFQGSKNDKKEFAICQNIKRKEFMDKFKMCKINLTQDILLAFESNAENKMLLGRQFIEDHV